MPPRPSLEILEVRDLLSGAGALAQPYPAVVLSVAAAVVYGPADRTVAFSETSQDALAANRVIVREVGNAPGMVPVDSTNREKVTVAAEDSADAVVATATATEIRGGVWTVTEELIVSYGGVPLVVSVSGWYDTQPSRVTISARGGPSENTPDLSVVMGVEEYGLVADPVSHPLNAKGSVPASSPEHPSAIVDFLVAPTPLLADRASESAHVAVLVERNPAVLSTIAVARLAAQPSTVPGAVNSSGEWTLARTVGRSDPVVLPSEDVSSTKAGSSPAVTTATAPDERPRELPLGADFLASFNPFDRATVERAFDQFIGRFGDLDAELALLSTPTSFVPWVTSSAALLCFVEILRRGARDRWEGDTQRLAGEGDVSLLGLPGLPGRWDSEET